MLPDLIETAHDYRASWRLPVYFGDEQARSEKAVEYLQEIDDALQDIDQVEQTVEARIDEYGDTGYQLEDLEDLEDTNFADRSLEGATVTYDIGGQASIGIEYDRNSGVTNFNVEVDGDENIRQTLEDRLDIPFYRTGVKRLLDIGRWFRI
ncbi:MAG: hypothetical protein SVU32_04640 [Candidatus Nanohaloarchaea archaeon]|nr:hypothetical protein [Candidatus Nanohaloarchaea archaeon]